MSLFGATRIFSFGGETERVGELSRKAGHPWDLGLMLHASFAFGMPCGVGPTVAPL